MPTPPMHRMAYPIETPEAYAFWGSRHRCNRVKAIIAFSENLAEANHNLRRHKFQFHLRWRALQAYGNYVAHPDMTGIPFTPAPIPWWECMPWTPLPKPDGTWAIWVDDTMWLDPRQWEEWIPDPKPLEETTNDDTTSNGNEETSDSIGNITDQ